MPSPRASPTESDGGNDVMVAVTGTLLLPTASQEFICDSNSNLQQVTLAVGKELSSKFQETFELPEEPQLSGVRIYKCIDPGDKNLSQISISNLETKEEQNPVMLSFQLSPPDQYENFFGKLVHQYKENVATATAGALIRDSEQSGPTHGKKRTRKKKVARTSTLTAQEIPQHTATPPASATGDPVVPPQSQLQEVLRRVETLESTVSRLRGQVGVLEDENKTLKFDNKHLRESNKRLQENNKRLQDRVESLEHLVQAQSKTLNSLHRRIILDRVRTKLVKKYNLTSETSNDLVHEAFSQLDNQDASLLPRDALRLIFTWSVIREAGNVAAHEASNEEISFAILSADLTILHRQLLEQIYAFVHDSTPTL